MRRSFFCLALLAALLWFCPIAGLRTLHSTETKKTSYLEKAVSSYQNGDWKKARIYLRLHDAKKDTKDSQNKPSFQESQEKSVSEQDKKTFHRGGNSPETADAAKLRLLLSLSGKADTKTRHLLSDYLMQSPDPFWFYYQGVLELSERHYQKAQESFQKALRFWQPVPASSIPKKTAMDKEASSYEPALMPLLCSWPLPEKSPLRAPLPRPFRETKKARAYWKRKLTREEALAAFYLQSVLANALPKARFPNTQKAAFFDAQVQKENFFYDTKTKQKNKASIPLRLDKRSLELFRYKLADRPTNERQRNHPTQNPKERSKIKVEKTTKKLSQKELYDKCAQSLHYELKEDLTGRLLRPYDKKKIRGFLLTLSFFRMLDLHTPESLLAYADLLLKKKRPHEALYVLRHFLGHKKLYQIQKSPAHLPLLQAMLEKLSVAYEQIGLKEDALSSERLASLIRNYLKNHPKDLPQTGSKKEAQDQKRTAKLQKKGVRNKETQASGQGMQKSTKEPPNKSNRSSYAQASYKTFLQEVFKLAGENLMHRESVLLLLELTEEQAKRQRLQKRLQTRDEKREDLELQKAFGYL